MAQSGNIIGKVTLIEGQVIARAPDGSQRLLKIGDSVYEGEVIITAENSRVEFSFDNGVTYLLRAQETLTLDSHVFEDQPQQADAGLFVADAEMEQIAQAIAGENSLDELLEETAAGLTGGGPAGEGHSFVQLARVAEIIAPS